MARNETFAPTVDRLVAGGFAEGPAYGVWRPRGTTDWLIINTVAGAGRFVTDDGTDALAQPGDLVALRPGTPHDYGTAPGSRGWELQFAHVHPRPDWMLLLDWPDVGSGVRRLHTTGEVRRRVSEAFDRTVTMVRSGLAQAELLGVNALEAALLWAATETPDAGRLDPRLVGVLEHIGSRLAEPLSLGTLARRAGMSTSRFTHLFVAQVGTPPMRFVETQRMLLAQQLLDLSGRTVAEVGRAVGYPDPLYFSARFKRFSGRSPTAYRRRSA